MRAAPRAHRRLVTKEEVAAAVVFFASPEAEFASGRCST
jgi:NAD(P)-dependent dehydrogenase (short-subunit alcohol dehydrogenase family)